MEKQSFGVQIYQILCSLEFISAITFLPQATVNMNKCHARRNPKKQEHFNDE